MPQEQPTGILGMLPWVAVAVCVVGGLWALRLVGQPPRVDRTDRGAALRLGAVLAALAFGGVALFFAALGNAWGGSAGAGLVAGVPIGLGAAALVFLSGIGAYALLARPRVGSIALIGVIAGPLALGAAVKVTLDWQAADAATANRARLQAAWQGLLDERVRLDVRDVQPITVQVRDSSQRLVEVVERVRLTVVVTVDRELGFYVDQLPVVWLFPTGAPDARLEATLPVRLPYVFPLGKEAFTIEALPPADASLSARQGRVVGAWSVRVTMLPGIPLPVTLESAFDMSAGH